MPFFSYLNINSIRNKFDNLKLIIDEHVDILCVAETKIDNSFPTAQFSWPGYHKPHRLDIYQISFTFSTLDKLYYAKGYSNYAV